MGRLKLHLDLRSLKVDDRHAKVPLGKPHAEKFEFPQSPRFTYPTTLGGWPESTVVARSQWQQSAPSFFATYQFENSPPGSTLAIVGPTGSGKTTLGRP